MSGTWAEIGRTTFPVVTLLLGAGLTGGTRRKEARMQAADDLADLTTYIWQKGGDDDYLNLKVALAKLRTALRRAGLPVRLVREVGTRALQFWRNVEDSGDPNIGLIVRSSANIRFDELSEVVLNYLDQPWRYVRNRRAADAFFRSSSARSQLGSFTNVHNGL